MTTRPSPPGSIGSLIIKDYQNMGHERAELNGNSFERILFRRQAKSSKWMRSLLFSTKFVFLFGGFFIEAFASTSNNEVILRFNNGSTRRYVSNDNPRRGSPVYYTNKGYLSTLDAYAVEVRRINVQLILLPARTGEEIKIGTHFSSSPGRGKIFSSDCFESGCYIQMISWPSGRNEYYSEHLETADKTDSTLLQAYVHENSMKWKSNREFQFEMPCAVYGNHIEYKPASLILVAKGWALYPTKPCAA